MDRLASLSAATAAPFVRSGRSSAHLDGLMLLALLPAVGVTLAEHGAHWLAPMGCSLAIAVAWQALFAVSRGRPMRADGALAAIAFAIMITPTVPLWQIALAMSFGIVVGQEIFGGRGYSFLNPAVVALSFLMLSFPGLTIEISGRFLTVAALVAALLLITTGLISWRVVVGAATGYYAAALMNGVAQPYPGLVSGVFAFGLIFYAADPVAAASTNPGRWLHGALFGAMTGFFAGSTTLPSIQSVVLAALLASVAAPLVDVGMTWFNGYWRRRRD